MNDNRSYFDNKNLSFKKVNWRALSSPFPPLREPPTLSVCWLLPKKWGDSGRSGGGSAGDQKSRGGTREPPVSLLCFKTCPRVYLKRTNLS